MISPVSATVYTEELDLLVFPPPFYGRPADAKILTNLRDIEDIGKVREVCHIG